jgi:ribosomal protein S27E
VSNPRIYLHNYDGGRSEAVLHAEYYFKCPGCKKQNVITLSDSEAGIVVDCMTCGRIAAVPIEFDAAVPSGITMMNHGRDLAICLMVYLRKNPPPVVEQLAGLARRIEGELPSVGDGESHDDDDGEGLSGA